MQSVLWSGTISVLVCLLPILLLLDLRSVFDFDWFNHLWMIEYFGEYIRRHGVPPAVLSTENLIGITMPIFYGGKFYWFSGIISSFLGSAISFRIIVFCSLITQFWHVERATRYARGNKINSMTVATVITWAIYPLTNLYNRSALTEFIAVLYLTSSVACLFVLLLRHSRGEKSYYDAVAVGFFYTIAAVTHPLTAVFGAGFIVCAGICFLLCGNRGWFAAVGLINAILIAGVLGSWLYVLHHYSGFLLMNGSSINQHYFRDVYFFPHSIDNIWSLFSPVALDLRTLPNGVRNVSTPFLDAQVNLPLILIGLALSYQWIRGHRGHLHRSRTLMLGMMLVSLFLFSLSLTIAINPSLSGYLGNVFDLLQFPYRLTTYLNLAALTFLLAVASLEKNLENLDRQPLRTREAVVLGVALGMSFAGLVSKLLHANATRFVDSYADLGRLAEIDRLPPLIDPKGRWTPLSGRSTGMLGTLPTSFYSHSQYMILEGYSLVWPIGFNQKTEVDFIPGSGQQFGEVAPTKINLPGSTLVVTNVQPFPWNDILVDGRRQKTSDLVVLAANWGSARGPVGVLALPLEAGEYSIQYRFQPARTWRVLEEISFAILVIWFFGWILAAIGIGARERCPRA